MNPKFKPRNRLKTVSPLLSALNARQSGTLSSTDDALLRCYAALDALRRGAGSRGLFSILGQHLILAINLCKYGYKVECFPAIRAAQQGLLDMRKQPEPDDWTLSDETYRALCDALRVLGEQLVQAPTAQVTHARNEMMSLLETVRRAA